MQGSACGAHDREPHMPYAAAKYCPAGSHGQRALMLSLFLANTCALHTACGLSVRVASRKVRKSRGICHDILS
jgi:hypothetical protein